MEDYAGRILADRYRLPLPPSDEYELVETRAFDTRSGQEVLVRQVPLPEIVDAELLDEPLGQAVRPAGRRSAGDLPAVRRAISAAQAAASVPDHPRLDQVFDVFAEGGSLWIVSELVPARPLAALIAEEPLSPYRAAEVAADVLTALRVLHAHGWTHRNITARTVLICDDGRVVLTGLAAGAAEDALCGYDPVPPESTPAPGGHAPGGGPAGGAPSVGPDRGGAGHADGGPLPGTPYGAGPAPDAGGTGLALRGPQGVEPAGSDGGPRTDGGPDAGGYAPLVAPGYDTGPRYSDHITPETAGERPELKAAARAGAIAAYRAGAQAAAARVTEQRNGGSEPGPEPRPQGSNLPQGYSYPYGGPEGGTKAPWHGATPRRQPALPRAGQPVTAEPEPAPRPDPAPVRPALPAHLALPEGYHQADAEAEAESPDPSGGLRPGGPQTGFAGPGQTPPHGAGGPAATPVPAPPPTMASYLPPADPDGRSRLEPAGAPSSGEGPDTAPYPRPGRPLHPRPQGAGEPDPVPSPVPGPAGAPREGWPGQGAADRAASAGAGWGGGGIRSGLDAERARQTRMAVVGAVTERWAPEQAGSVAGPWQLAAPVGPATDLWGLGALLYRAVQGHAPYPEDSVTELVDMVCAEAPAFAEECGPLRPVVESLLRQDPTERPDFEELRGWLRSLVRSAPEPDGGLAALPMPEPDPARLPVVRRRGDLHGRHRNPAASRTPRSLGRTLLVGVLALLAGAVAYALLFLPRAGEQDEDAAGKAPVGRQSPAASPATSPSASASAPAADKPGQTPRSAPPPAPAPAGYTTQQDPEHFEIAVPDGWERRGMNEAGQVRYTDGEYVLTVVPGRDKVDGSPDPATYQKDKEPELAPYRSSTWASGGDVKTTKVGQQLRVTGRYTWIDGNGRSVVARNFVVALGGSYHVVMVSGPQDGEGKVTEVFEKATGSYRAGG
ncbi:protein kinase [Streptomyces sp. NPDC086989]|uniref:protein kinase n=1 Tax=Streptomyces sp. NPDC086989 TaxID=3365764 RepID=UPI00382A210C